MIQIENLVKHYGLVRALDGLNLTVERGVVYGFLGPNGAGKTTTMRILAGLARPDEGQVSIFDHAVNPESDIRTLIGVMPEEPVFYAWMTAREFLRDLIAPLYGFRASDARHRTEELLHMVGLQNTANRRLQGFSRGMRQRLSLAAAMLHRPPVLLLDEPVSALDPAGRKEVLELLESLSGKTTILLSTHILADVERICDVIGIINQGHLVLQQQRTALLASYAQSIIEVEVEKGIESWITSIQDLPIVETISLDDRTARISVNNLHAAQSVLLEKLNTSNLLVQRFEVVQPSLEDIFLRLTQKED